MTRSALPLHPSSWGPTTETWLQTPRTLGCFSKDLLSSLPIERGDLMHQPQSGIQSAFPSQGARILQKPDALGSWEEGKLCFCPLPGTSLSSLPSTERSGDPLTWDGVTRIVLTPSFGWFSFMSGAGYVQGSAYCSVTLKTEPHYEHMCGLLLLPITTLKDSEHNSHSLNVICTCTTWKAEEKRLPLHSTRG